MALTLVVADDHRIVREGLRAVLAAEPDFRLVGEAGDGLEAVRLTERLRPNVLILDLRLPGLAGVEVARRVARRCPGTAVVVLSMHCDPAYVAEALEAGARAFVPKDAGVEELVRAVRAAAAGEEYVSPALPLEAVAELRRRAGEGADPYAALTPREREVLQLTTEGCSCNEVARRLFISPRTVETHRANVMRKLGVRNQKELIRYAVRREQQGRGEGDSLPGDG